MTAVSASAQPPLVVEDLCVTYDGDRRAVRGIDLKVDNGRCVALVGESGSGKSSVAHAILGLLPRGARATGSVRLGGDEVLGLSERALRRVRGVRVGLVAQDPMRSFDQMVSVRRSVEEAWRVHGRVPAVGEVDQALGALGIVNPARMTRRRPHEWSGGMLQRAAIVAAAAHRPALLVADEPTSALDADRADSVLEALRATGSGVLLISHDLDLVSRHSDEIAVMYSGRIVERRSADEVLQRPLHPYSAALLAASARPGAGMPRPIPGELPGLGSLSAGCPFSPRCNLADKQCTEAEPVLVAGVACWRAGRGQ